MLGRSDFNEHRCLEPYRKLPEVLDLGETRSDTAASLNSATGHWNANLTQPLKESKSWSLQMEKDLEIRDFSIVTLHALILAIFQSVFSTCRF